MSMANLARMAQQMQQENVGLRSGHRAECTVPAVSASGACPACGGPLRPWRSVRPADPFLGHEPVPVSRCERCGSAVTGGLRLPGM